MTLKKGSNQDSFGIQTVTDDLGTVKAGHTDFHDFQSSVPQPPQPLPAAPPSSNPKVAPETSN